MKRTVLMALSLGLAASTAWAGFTPGNVVVLQCVHDPNGGAGALVEFNRTTGATGYQVTLPFSTTDTGSSIVFGQSSTLNHDITRSGDGAFLVVPGYAAAVSSVDSASGGRVIAMVKYDGTYSRPISYVNAWAFRGAASDGFGNFWGMTGTGGTDNGTPYLGTGPYALVQPTTGRAVAVIGGNLYYSVTAGVLGYSGTPTTVVGAGATVINATLMGSPTAAPGGFALPATIDVGSIAYLVDYNSASSRIGHYHWDGSSWAFDYSVALPTGKAQHIAVDYTTPSTPIVYVTPTHGAANNLYYFVDNSSTPTVTLLATAPTGKAFRGLAMAPVEPGCPVITSHPANVTNEYGATVSFTNVATGANPNAYTWTRNGTNLLEGATGTGSRIIGANSNIMSVVNIGDADQTWYRAVAHNNGPCTVTSDPAFLGVRPSCINPKITSIDVVQGSTATFTAGTASCLAPLTFSWYYNDTTLLSDGYGGYGEQFAGTTTSSLSIINAQPEDSGAYKVTLIDGNGEPHSSIATLTVCTFPFIDPQPVSQGKASGQTASFTIGATGNGLSYQWKKGTTALNDGPTGTGSILGGTHTPTLWITNVSPVDVGNYSCTVSNVAGSVSSDPATLSVGDPPVFTASPVSLIVTSGQSAVFTATVTGSQPMTYSWKHNADTLADDGKYSGTSTTTLTVTDVQVGDAQSYTLTAGNPFGTNSATAVIRFVYALPEPHTVPGLVIYEKFNYPAQAAPGFPTPNTWINSWQDLISAWNEATGQPAWWERLDPRPYCTVDNVEGPNGIAKSGTYPWRGLDCSVTKEWYSSSAPNNNHLMFGGIDQTNGAAYFSFVLNISQSTVLADDGCDTIAGLTTGTGLANADNWVFRICTHNSNGGDGFQLGAFKGVAAVGVGSVNGQWTPGYFPRNTMHFVVGCYKFNSGTNLVNGSITNNDVISLWVDPDRSTFGAVQAPAPTLGGMVTNWAPNAPITEFAIKGLVPPSTRRYTDLRIGTTWASVTPRYYPTIHYTESGGNLTLSWDAKYTKGDVASGFHSSGYELYESADLLTWTKSTAALSLVGDQATVTVTPGAGRFYQLKY